MTRLPLRQPPSLPPPRWARPPFTPDPGDSSVLRKHLKSLKPVSRHIDRPLPCCGVPVLALGKYLWYLATSALFGNTNSEERIYSHQEPDLSSAIIGPRYESKHRSSNPLTVTSKVRTEGQGTSRSVSVLVMGQLAWYWSQMNATPGTRLTPCP